MKTPEELLELARIEFIDEWTTEEGPDVSETHGANGRALHAEALRLARAEGANRAEMVKAALTGLCAGSGEGWCANKAPEMAVQIADSTLAAMAEGGSDANG